MNPRSFCLRIWTGWLGCFCLGAWAAQIPTTVPCVGASSVAALELAQWLEKQSQIERVYYPGLPSHPQHALAMKQQKSGGGIVSFDVKGGKNAAWRVIDHTQLLSITANLGDTKTTITHPASTTHGRSTPEARKAAGISDGLVRIAVGLEGIEDIKADVLRGLKQG